MAGQFTPCHDYLRVLRGVRHIWKYSLLCTVELEKENTHAILHSGSTKDRCKVSIPSVVVGLQGLYQRLWLNCLQFASEMHLLFVHFKGLSMPDIF
jgi:hypothetical protein